MPSTPRHYQFRAINRCVDSITAGKRPVLVAPTGSGKTFMACAIVQRLNVPTVWLAHRKELIEQGAASLESRGLAVGIIKAGVAPTRGGSLWEAMPGANAATVHVASVQTLVNRNKPNAKLIVVDECHHAAADTYQQILAEYPDAWILGLTATPFRTDGRGLGDLFGDLIVAATTRDLVEAGYLHQPKVWASKSPDLRGLRVVGGDYSTGELAKRVNTKELQADIVQTWQKHANGKRTVVFACNVEHSRSIAYAFQAAGVYAEHLDAGSKDRDAVLSRLAAGTTHVVSNCMVLTEGWDLPALECAILARPTASLSLHLQMIGRVMRAAEGKGGAIILDHAGNHHMHGLATRPLKLSLDGGARAVADEPLGIKRCRQCGLMFDVDLPACPECGFVPAGDGGDRSMPISGKGELSEFDDSSFEYRREFWNLIESQRIAAGYKEGWSTFRYRDRFGIDPVVVGGELIEARRATLDQKRDTYQRLAAVAAEKGFAAGWASHRYKELFGCWPHGFVKNVRTESIRRRFLERV